MSESQTKASVDLEAIESLRKAEAAHIKMAAKLKTYREGLEAALRELHRPNAPASQDIRMADVIVDKEANSSSMLLSTSPFSFSLCSPASDTAQGAADSPDASDMESSSSGTSWVDYNSSRCPSVMSNASSRSFPDDAFVFPTWGAQLGASWVSCFKRLVVGTGPYRDQELFFEYPVHEPVPEYVRSIPFEAPSKSRLARTQDYDRGWIVVTEPLSAEIRDLTAVGPTSKKDEGSASHSAETSATASKETRNPSAALPSHWPSQPYVGRFSGSDNQQVLLGNWAGAFRLHEVKIGPLKGRMVFKEERVFDFWVPKHVDAVPFAGPSKDFLVRLAGSESLWAIMQ